MANRNSTYGRGTGKGSGPRVGSTRRNVPPAVRDDAPRGRSRYSAYAPKDSLDNRKGGYGERRDYGGKKPSYGKGQEAGGKSRYDGKSAYGKKPSYDGKPVYGKGGSGGKPRYGEKPAFGKKTAYDAKPAYSKSGFDRKPLREEKPAFGKKPRFDDMPATAFDRWKDDPFYEEEVSVSAGWNDGADFGETGFSPAGWDDEADFSALDRLDGGEDAGEAEDSRENAENILAGRNPIREALKAGRDIEKLLVAKGDKSGSAREIIAMARENRVVVQEVDRSRLDAVYPGHQGMIAFVSAARYADVDDIFDAAEEKGEPPFIVILDGITDPHNLGAIIRTAECCGAHGVIVPRRRGVGLTPAAVKAAAGAQEYVKVARVVNLARTIKELKDKGVWVYGADMDGENAFTAPLDGPAALVIGSEGDGVSEHVLSLCDRRVALPMKGRISSLNASVAAGVLMYQVMRARS